MEKLLESVFILSKGVPLHLIFLVDESSVKKVKSTLWNTYSRCVTERIIVTEKRFKSTENSKYKFPKVDAEFVDYTNIIDKFSSEVDILKKHFNNWDKEYNVKGR